MIKGHTKIELTNVKTGQKKVIEDTNMITNGMSNFMMSNPFNSIPLSVGYRPFVDDVPRSYQLCGGLLLFNKPIAEDPDMIFPPAGNKMIGNACAGISSGSAIPEFGYFDANNSTFEYEGDTTTQKFVFDFSTSQGNGEISSVCLGSMLAGYMGFGNHSGMRTDETVGNLNFSNTSYNPFYEYNFGHYSSSVFYATYNRNNETKVGGYPFLIDYHKNCIYMTDWSAFIYNSSAQDQHFSSGTLKLQKYYFPLSSLNPLHKISTSYLGVAPYQECTVEIPSEIVNAVGSAQAYNQVFNSYDGTYLIVTGKSSNYIEPDATFYVLHVNADLETKLYTVKNTTGKRIWNVYTRYTTNYYKDTMAIKDGYLFCQTYENNTTTPVEFFKISLTDSTDVVSLGTLTHKTTLLDFMNFSYVSNRLFIHNNSTNNKGHSNFAEYIIDDVENVILPVNTRFWRKELHHFAICGCDFMYFVVDNISTGTADNDMFLMFNPMYLATINNLPEPVVKTADLTMKITYTLTCTEEGRQEGDS